MYTKNDRIYAEAGYYLVCGNSIGRNLLKDDSQIVHEVKMKFDDLRIIKTSNSMIAVCSDGKVKFLIPNEPTYDNIKKSIVNGRFSSEEQVDIIINKDTDDEAKKEYERLMEMIDHAEKVTKLICPLVGIEVVETLDFVKADMLKTIAKYDTSKNVNNFKYNGNDYWIDKSTRVGLMNSTSILINQGEENATLWFNGEHFVLPCKQLILMLSQIEAYALECFNVTARHKAEVSAMTKISDIKNYDYTKDYPEQLSF